MLHFCYVASSLFEVSRDHIPIGRSFHFSLTFEVINLKNAVEYSCLQSVSSVWCLENCEVKRWNQFLYLVALASVANIFIHSLFPETSSIALWNCTAQLYCSDYAGSSIHCIQAIFSPYLCNISNLVLKFHASKRVKCNFIWCRLEGLQNVGLIASFHWLEPKWNDLNRQNL